MNMIEKNMFDGSKVKIIGENYEPGKPAGKGEWKKNFTTREEYVKYLKQAERYWYIKEGFGSEKRKNPA